MCAPLLILYHPFKFNKTNLTHTTYCYILNYNSILERVSLWHRY